MDNYRTQAKPAVTADTDPDPGNTLVARFMSEAQAARRRRIKFGRYEYSVRFGARVGVERVAEVHIQEWRRSAWWRFWEEPALHLVEVELVKGLSVHWHRPDGRAAHTPWEVLSRAARQASDLGETEDEDDA